MSEKTSETARGAALAELSGDWLRDKLKDAPRNAPQPTPKPESQGFQTQPEEADSVAELASALLHATTKPLQALERDWSAQLQTLQSGINERFGAVEQVASKMERFEGAIEPVREALRGTDSRVERAENQIKESLERIESLKATVSEQVKELTASLEQVRADMAAQDKMLQDLRQAEERRAQGVERLAEAFGGAQDAVGLLATALTQPRSE